MNTNSTPYLRMRLQCMHQHRHILHQSIEELFGQVGVCCPSSSSSQSPSLSSSVPPSSSSSSSSGACPEFESPYLFDEWLWDIGTDNGIGEGVNTWTGARNSKVLTTVPGREDSKRAKVQDGCILVNGDPLDKRAYHAYMPADWYPSGDTIPPLGNALFWIVEIDLFKTGESVLWNHMISGGPSGTYNSFSSQTSTQTIGTRTNGNTYSNIARPSWIQEGVQRYMVEMRYGYAGSSIPYDFSIAVNGKVITTVISTSALREIIGAGVVAPLDYSANSTLNRRILSILTLQNPASNLYARIPQSIFQQTREYLACKWNISLQS